MQRSRTRLFVLFAALVAFVIVSALLYEVGMSRLEGKPRTFMESLEWAAESLSTTGYGYDSHWTHPAMVMLVITVQFVGVFLVFLIIPVYLLPFLAERFEQRVPRVANDKLANHVIVFRYGPAVETLLLRLAAANVPSIVVELDEVSARGVMETGQSVLFSRSEEDALVSARVGHARAIVANGKDQENAALILRARQGGFRGEIYSFVEVPAHRKAMELAGATAAYTPRHIVAAALAAHASEKISPRLPGLESIPSMQRRDMRVPVDSPAVGKRFGDLDLGAVVVGQWVRSRLQAPCTPDVLVEPGAVLEIVGDAGSLQHAASVIGGSLLRDRGPILIAGFGEVGRKVHELLRDAGEDVRVIERHHAPDVDVAGDVLDSSVLARAGLSEARALILALDSDDSTLFATVISRDSAPDTAVIARVNHGRNLENIHRAGADYAQSISDVSGEMLSARLLKRSTRVRDEHRRVSRIDVPPVPGISMQELRGRAGACSVLALERAGSLLKDVARLQIEPGDSLWVCGTTEAIRSFAAQFTR
ncbi:MAG TPA: NAD-binding protein [Thermoanaerobaculia bacterium]